MADAAGSGGGLATPHTRLDSSSSPKAKSPEASSPDAPPNTKAAPTAQQHQPDGHILGLRKENGQPMNVQHVFSDDYEKLLPEDEYGQEAAPNARIWRAYEQEAATYDTVMIGQARDGLDVMLVFAGLFSAVVTSFLVQVAQNLQPDFSEMNALLLHDLVVMQMETTERGGAASPNVTAPSANPTAEFTPDALDVWVNGLWVVSLATSLTVALSAVLVKQWLHRYMALPSGTVGLRSHTRHFRFVGFEEWHVEAIIGGLPLVMHLSLALFFTGLILFYVPLRLSLAYTLGGLSAIVLALYISSNILPLFRPQCPYQTPLTDSVAYVIFYLMSIVHKVRQFGSELAQKVTRTRLGKIFTHIRFTRNVPLPVDAGTNGTTSTPPTLAPQGWPHWLLRTLISFRQRETRAVELRYDELSVDAMQWVFHMTSNPTVHNIVLQAIPGLPYEIRHYARSKWQFDQAMLSRRHDLLCLKKPPNVGSELWRTPWEDTTVERLLRSAMFLPYPASVKSDQSDYRNCYGRVVTLRLSAASWLPRGRSDWVDPAVHPAVDIAESLLRTLAPLQLQNSHLHLNLWKDFIPRVLESINGEHSPPWLVARLLALVLPASVHRENTGERSLLPDVMHLTHAVTCTSFRDTVLASLEQGSLLRPYVESTACNRFVNLSSDHWREDRIFASVLHFMLNHYPTHEDGAPAYQPLLLRIFDYILSFKFWENSLLQWIDPLFEEDNPVIDMLIDRLDSQPSVWEENISMCFTKLITIYYNLNSKTYRMERQFASLPKIFAAILRPFLRDTRRLVFSLSLELKPGGRFSSVSTAELALNLTRDALRRGRTEVYRAFFDLGLLSMLCEFTMLNLPWLPGDEKLSVNDIFVARAVGDFVQSLVSLPVEDRVKALETLQQRHNLQMATVIIVCHHSSESIWNRLPSSTITTLIGLPSDDHDHSPARYSRQVVLEMLHSLNAWLKYQALPATERDSDQVEPEFPLQDVVGLLDPAASGDGLDRLGAIKKGLVLKGELILQNGQNLLDFLEGGAPWPWK